MTQEEKAEKYDEALRRARKLKEDPTSVFYEYSPSEGDTIADYIFPELKGSEDEKIRKALICGMYALKEQHKTCFASIPIDNVIAWLEKQSEQKSQGKSALEAINEEKVDNSNRVEPKDYNSIDPHFGKPADKVEPKFHEGEWIVWQDKYYKVNYNGCGYELVDQNGLNTSLEYGTIDENAHLFTIEDAKDGDVLYTPNGAGVEGIFLIKGWKQDECAGKTLCSCIGYRVGEDEIVVGGLGAIWWEGVVDTFYPATKEQRDLLFQKMKEAGYKWDAKLKRLKKIEDETEIPFGAKDSELQEATYYIPKGFHAEIDEDKVAIKKGELNIRKLESLVKQIWATAEHENDKDTIHKMSNLSFFLKTLKPQLKQEWSEEDETSIAVNNPDAYKIGFADGEAHAKEEQWKPSDAQMIALNDVITNGNLSNANGRILKGLKDQLKKL